MNSLLGKLTTLLSDEYKLLSRVRKQIKFLERELSSMRVLLETLADMEEELDKQAKEWRDNVRDLTYEMEDCIDRFMDRLGSGGARRGFMKRTVRLLRTLWERHDIATQIKDLKARVMEESERRVRYKLEENYYTATRTVKIDPRITALHEEVPFLVAMDNPLNHVTALLMDGEMELKVVPIVGSGGLGKTTLAMKVYRNIGSRGYFQCQASVSVSRALDLEKLLKDILSQINDKEYHSDGLKIDQLIRKTAEILTGKRYFIVIDDVWKEQDWNLVKAAFPNNNNGSRIIATTRITAVANLCCLNSGGQPYQMEPLGDVDSQRLFFKRIFGSNDPCPAELKEVSNRILKKCGGLPLAISTFASLLASRKTRKKDEWESLEDLIGVGSSLTDDGNLKRMKDILLLGYWDLPHQLKSCLLYLCLYPEDYTIKCEELKWKWMAEGFIATQWGRLDQIADNCLNELVNRNMIQPVHVDSDGYVKFCRVHDMVLDLIISLSDEEKFATILNGRICNYFPSKIRRLSMQSSGKEHNEVVLSTSQTKSHVRSLTMFWGVKHKPYLVGFHALRVLDLLGCKGLENKHVKNIGSSRQLRYLRICSPEITELPREIGELQHLEILDLRGSSFVRRLPSTIVHLQKLVRLFVGCKTHLPACGFGGMKALEDLEIINIRLSDDSMRLAEELGHLSNLRILHISPDLELSDTLRERLVSSISELGKCNLRCLDIGGDICQQLFSDPLCTYPYLQDLRIVEWTHIEMVPKGMASLDNLVKLSMKVKEFDKDGLHLLMGMPSMAHLQLEIMMEIKEKLTIGSNGFKFLKVFHFTYTAIYHSLVEPIDRLRLTFASGAVPALRRLRLDLSPMDVAYDFFAGLGVENLSGLAHFEVEIQCYQAAPSWVEAMESSIEDAIIGLHPNCEIHVKGACQANMFKDDKEWEEAVAEKRKERGELREGLWTIMEEDETSE